MDTFAISHNKQIIFYFKEGEYRYYDNWFKELSPSLYSLIIASIKKKKVSKMDTFNKKKKSLVYFNQ